MLYSLSPFALGRQLENIKNLTPEEYETVMRSLYEAKLNCKLYATLFTAATLCFTYWQRAFVPRWFYFFSLTCGVTLGVTYGTIRTGWHLVENLDALGKDYELSRMIKQDIFDSRPDIDAGMRAQYYIHQQKQRDEFDRKHGTKQ